MKGSAESMTGRQKLVLAAITLAAVGLAAAFVLVLPPSATAWFYTVYQGLFIVAILVTLAQIWVARPPKNRGGAVTGIDGEMPAAVVVAPIGEATYECRRSGRRAVETFRLIEDTFAWPGGSLAFSDIKTIRFFSLPRMPAIGLRTMTRPRQDCWIYPRHGRTIVIPAIHHLDAKRFEDRSASLRLFVRALATDATRANPKVRLLSGMPPLIWWFWFLTFGALTVALALALPLALLGLIAENNLSWATGGFLLAMAALLVGPALVFRAVWHRRSRRVALAEI